MLPAFVVAACAAGRPEHLGLKEGALIPCPSSTSCVSSAGGDVEPFEFEGLPNVVWDAVAEVVATLPEAAVVERTDNYLRAECTSRVFRFVDDLELHLKPSQGQIAVRSASRMGHWDLGVNRRRVESLRKLLREKGVAR